MIHDGWSPYDNFALARHQQCLGHLLRRYHEMRQSATGGAVRFPRRIKKLLKPPSTCVTFMQQGRSVLMAWPFRGAGWTTN
jgi:hypothetical protein